MPAVFSSSGGELAYLANTHRGWMLDSGDGRLRSSEASDAAAATCNLGLENWPRTGRGARARPPEGFLVDHDLVSVFQVGWTGSPCRRLPVRRGTVSIDTLSDLRCDDREIQSGLNALRVE